ncbi:hypothetical protein [Salinibacterium sp. ZJ77]|uniref:hypothetical protein n=1 Tax=Salinibacterium sp. ZJ77 TaxID=2708337 RepID=UPI001420A412|nr:hypothetical protein [Salinibacterium sp. ZJ77]
MTALKTQSPQRGASQPGSARKGGKAVSRSPLFGPPRADLLPPEITDGHKKKAARRGMRWLMVAALFAAVAATGGAYYLELQANAARDAAERESELLLVEQVEFADVRSTLKGIAEGEAAVRVGGSTDIDWSSYFRQLQALLPGDVTLTTITVESADILEPYEQSEVPLERPRIATLTFTAESPVVPSIPSWIESLTALPGFADASPSGIVSQGDVYLGTVVLHINTDAYSQRFTAEEGESE